MATKSKAELAITRGRTVLLVSNPFYGVLALQLQLVEVPDGPLSWCETMAVDGTHLFFSPKFTLGLSEPEVAGVVAHEVSHCAFQHMTRRGQRDPYIWNCAGDFVINSDLKKAGFTLPGSPITLKSPPGTKGHLYDPQYDGMSTEEVYERILTEAKKRQAQGGGGKGQNQQGQGQGSGPQQPNGQSGPMRDPGGCGGVIDAAPSHDKAKADQVAREWEATVRMAVAVAKANNAGTLPGHLERLVKQLQQPKVSWRELTRQFIDQSMTKDYSWSRPNRRYLGQGLVMPGFVPDALHHMIFIGDTSGSISNELLTAFVSEAAGALNDGVADKLTILYADTRVHDVQEFFPGDLVTAKTSGGGGGTDFVDAFNWIMTNAPDASCVVYLTDMQPNHWNLPEPDMPVLWGAFGPENFVTQVKVPFGQVVHVESAL